MEPEENKQRTLRQNSSLHLFFEMLAKELNDAGLSVMKTLRHDAEIPWCATKVKELLWRPVQIAMLDKESTTELETDEVTKVYEVVNRHLAQNHGVHVPFPCVETQFGGFK